MKDRTAALRFGSRSAVHLADLALLVRAPAALSVPGDVIAGALAPGPPTDVCLLVNSVANWGSSGPLKTRKTADAMLQGNSIRRGGA
ncbi:hypothetical protein [Streptomyces montanus]|uniref:hypothetical protein n=1 Tax=Streptomyces montanus TaxID=2580423 RepID=UPI001FE61DC4|nr:hypothetical protein [Streptomyces montanus]